MKDIVCCGCSVVCDDVAVEAKKGKLKSLGLCRLGYEYCSTVFSKRRLFTPYMLNKGSPKKVTQKKALKEAAELLKNSQRPLLLGWVTSSNEAIQIGLKIAQQVQGVFYSVAAIEYGNLLEYGFKGGEAALSSLEDVRNFADHVVYWGVNPAESHHRHASRYTIFPKGEKIPEGRESRTVSVIDIRPSESMRLANHQLILQDAKGDEQLLSAILDELQGKGKVLPENIAGIPPVEFLSFIKHLQEAEYIALFYGNGLIQSSHVSKTFPLLQKIINLLNSNNRRCITLPMIAHCNTIGTIKTCLHQTNLPFSVDFTSNPPKPHSSVLKGLMHREFDVALISSLDVLSWLPGPTAQALSKIPYIALSSLPTFTTKSATITIPVSIIGAETEGTVHRMDGTTVQLLPFQEPAPGIFTEENVLRQILEQIA